MQGELAGLGERQVLEIVHEPFEKARVFVERVDRVPVRGGQAVLQGLELGAHVRQGRPQLVRNVAHEVSSERFLPGDRVRHRVERPSELAQLVAGRDGHPNEAIALLHSPRGVRQRFDRAEEPPGESRDQEQGREPRGHGRAGEPPVRRAREIARRLGGGVTRGEQVEAPDHPAGSIVKGSPRRLDQDARGARARIVDPERVAGDPRHRGAAEPRRAGGGLSVGIQHEDLSSGRRGGAGERVSALRTTTPRRDRPLRGCAARARRRASGAAR